MEMGPPVLRLTQNYNNNNMFRQLQCLMKLPVTSRATFSWVYYLFFIETVAGSTLKGIGLLKFASTTLPIKVMSFLGTGKPVQARETDRLNDDNDYGNGTV